MSDTKFNTAIDFLSHIVLSVTPASHVSYNFQVGVCCFHTLLRQVFAVIITKMCLVFDKNCILYKKSQKKVRYGRWSLPHDPKLVDAVISFFVSNPGR